MIKLGDSGKYASLLQSTLCEYIHNRHTTRQDLEIIETGLSRFYLIGSSSPKGLGSSAPKALTLSVPYLLSMDTGKLADISYNDFDSDLI